LSIYISLVHSLYGELLENILWREVCFKYLLSGSFIYFLTILLIFLVLDCHLMHKLIYRPFVITIIVLGLSTLLALGSLSSISWHNQQRINAIKQDIQRGNQLQQQVLYLLEHQRLEQRSDSSDTTRMKQQNATHDKIIQGLKKQYAATNTNRQLLAKMHYLLQSVEQGNHK